MANAYVCDRCGAFYKSNELSWEVDGKKICGITLDGKTSHTSKTLDFCDDCVLKLKKFIENKED